mgnify:CR=1 FL=1
MNVPALAARPPLGEIQTIVGSGASSSALTIRWVESRLPPGVLSEMMIAGGAESAVSPLGIAGPKGLPESIMAKLDAAVKAALDDPEVKKTMANYGVRSDYRDHKAYAEFARKAFAEEKDIVTGLGLNE